MSRKSRSQTSLTASLTQAQRDRVLQWLPEAEKLACYFGIPRRYLDDFKGAARLALCQLVIRDTPPRPGDFRLALWFAVRAAVQRERRRLQGGATFGRLAGGLGPVDRPADHDWRWIDGCLDFAAHTSGLAERTRKLLEHRFVDLLERDQAGELLGLSVRQVSRLTAEACETIRSSLSA